MDYFTFLRYCVWSKGGISMRDMDFFSTDTLSFRGKADQQYPVKSPKRYRISESYTTGI